MAILTPTPILKSILTTFPADTAYDFEFVYSGSSQAVKNNLVIERLSDNIIVYDVTIDSFSLKHILPANILVNGNDYRVKIRVGDINGNWTEFSDWVIFWVFSKPIITITSIDSENKVYNQTINFQSTYMQAENDSLQSYKYILYDSNKNMLQVFEEKYDGLLQQEITGLENGVIYFLEVKTTSIHEAIGTSGLIQFQPFYVAPRLSVVLTPENIKEDGTIKLLVNVVQIIGKIDIGTINYISNDWIDLTNGQISFQDGFDISQSNFLMQIWCRNIPNDIVFLKLISNYGRIELIKYNNRIHALKYSTVQSIVPHFVSNEVIINTDENFIIIMKHINNLIDLQIQKLI